MKSSGSDKLANFERDLPTNAEDVRALRLARECRRLSFEHYLAFLSRMPSLSRDALRARKGHAGDKPFDI